jgi:hypothetical protein
MKNNLNPMMTFWIGPLRSAEGVDGGGAGDGGSGADAGAAAAGGDAGASPAAAPATFLGEAAAKQAEGQEPPKEGEAPAGETKEESPAAFDVAALQLPEGFELNAETGKVFAELMSDDKLSPQERGQKMLDLHATALKETTEALVEQVTKANLDAWTKMNDEWRTAIKELPEFKSDPDAE